MLSQRCVAESTSLYNLVCCVRWFWRGGHSWNCRSHGAHWPIHNYIKRNKKSNCKTLKIFLSVTNTLIIYSLCYLILSNYVQWKLKLFSKSLKKKPWNLKNYFSFSLVSNLHWMNWLRSWNTASSSLYTSTVCYTFSINSTLLAEWSNH